MCIILHSKSISIFFIILNIWFSSCRRVLQAMHHAKIEETIAQAKALMKAMKTGGMVADVSTVIHQ